MAPFGSYHPITKLAFLDELEKISKEVTPQQQESREKAKRFIKGSLAFTAGSAAGVGAFMVGDVVARKVLGTWWTKQPRSVKEFLLSAAGAGATIGTAYFTKRLLEEKKKYDLR